MLSVTHLIFLSESPTMGPFSGAENHLLTLLPALQAVGIHVELGILLRQMGPTIRAKIADLHTHGIAVTCFPSGHRLDPLCLYALSRHFAARRDYIVHTHLDYADVYGKIAARSAGCSRIVSTVHNNEPHHLRPQWFYLLRLLDQFTSQHIAISETVRRHLIELERVASHKVTVIPYGVPKPGPADDKLALRARLGLPSDRFIIGFVGRLAEQKNVSLLISAMAHMPDAYCAIVGNGPLRKQLESQAEGLNNVQFLGHLPQAEIFMPAFDVLCLPSRWEGLGLVLIEAMLRRVPVVGSWAGAIPEVLENGEYGLLVDPDDPVGLVTALRTAQTCGTALAEKAYRHALESYTVDKMIERTLTLYKRVIA